MTPVDLPTTTELVDSSWLRVRDSMLNLMVGFLIITILIAFAVTQGIQYRQFEASMRVQERQVLVSESLAKAQWQSVYWLSRQTREIEMACCSCE